jgi:Ran GTPase-activating protein (RanGAP) involved in mRNA processing and transport
MSGGKASNEQHEASPPAQEGGSGTDEEEELDDAPPLAQEIESGTDEEGGSDTEEEEEELTLDNYNFIFDCSLLGNGWWMGEKDVKIDVDPEISWDDFCSSVTTKFDARVLISYISSNGKEEKLKSKVDFDHLCDQIEEEWSDADGDGSVHCVLQYSLAVEAFAGALETIPADHWWRTWAANRTSMLRMTSRRVKDAVDKICPPAVVKLSRTFRGEVEQDTMRVKFLPLNAADRVHHILTQLETMTSRCSITTLDVSKAGITRKDADRLAGVLAQCPELSHLNLGGNQLGDEGAARLALVLPLCPALAHIDLRSNWIEDEGTARLAAVLEQCPALSRLDLADNSIRDEGAGKLAGVLPQCPALSHLYLKRNILGDQGAGRLAEVLPQCPALSHLNLSSNEIGEEGKGMLKEALSQCPRLPHMSLDLSDNMSRWEFESLL